MTVVSPTRRPPNLLHAFEDACEEVYPSLIRPSRQVLPLLLFTSFSKKEFAILTVPRAPLVRLSISYGTNKQRPTLGSSPKKCTQGRSSKRSSIAAVVLDVIQLCAKYPEPTAKIDAVATIPDSVATVPQRDCGACGDPFALTTGIVCKLADHFLCTGTKS